MKIVQHKSSKNKICNECKSEKYIRELKLKNGISIPLCKNCREDLYVICYRDVMIRKHES